MDMFLSRHIKFWLRLKSVGTFAIYELNAASCHSSRKDGEGGGEGETGGGSTRTRGVLGLGFTTYALPEV